MAQEISERSNSVEEAEPHTASAMIIKLHSLVENIQLGISKTEEVYY